MAMMLNAFADESSGSFKEQIDALLRNGLNGLEVRAVDGQNIAEISLKKAKEMKEQLAANGLNTWSIGSRLGKIKITDSFAPHMDEFRYTLEVAHALDAKYIRLFSFYMPKDEDPAIYRNEVLARMAEFVEAAKGSGIKLCHENEKGIYGDVASRCLEIQKALPSLGCIFDPANFVQCGQDTLEAWDMLAPYMTYMHIKDALPDGKVVPAGKGAGNVREIVARYRANGGIALTAEPHLSVFDALKSLEQEGDVSVVNEYAYPSKEAAFDAGVAAMRDVAGE